jgi:GrpB-like predicted nucleotidyltransferase (UPF0157 family)
VVVVEPYSEEWTRRYLSQSSQLTRALGPRITAIEHVGSTAIAGLPAKPVIDIAARAAAGADPSAFGPLIEGSGYQLHRSGPQTHAVYVRGTDAGRTDILHVFTPVAWTDCNQRVIRDKLLHDGDARRRYGELKVQLAASGIEGLDYTAAKVQLIQEMLDEERAARGLPPGDAWEK